MKFSLITVTFNSEKTLSDTIESVLQQTYHDIEYIVIDGLSTDNTTDIIKKYEPLFYGKMRWISEKDNGLYDAMNKGFQMANGEIVGIINSDDILFDTKAIEKVITCFKRNDSLDAVYADLYYVNQDDTNKIIRHWKSGKQYPFKKGWHPAHPTFYVRKIIYDKYGLFDLNFRFAADFELMLRLIEKYHINLYYLPEFLVKMRLGGKTSKNLSNIRKGNLECLKAFEKNGIHVFKPFYLLNRLILKLKQFVVE